MNKKNVIDRYKTFLCSIFQVFGEFSKWEFFGEKISKLLAFYKTELSSTDKDQCNCGRNKCKDFIILCHICCIDLMETTRDLEPFPLHVRSVHSKVASPSLPMRGTHPSHGSMCPFRWSRATGDTQLTGRWTLTRWRPWICPHRPASGPEATVTWGPSRPAAPRTTIRTPMRLHL